MSLLQHVALSRRCDYPCMDASALLGVFGFIALR